MNASRFIKSKQQGWALINNIDLIGSKIDRGEKCYTEDLKSNLFIDLSEETSRDISNGDGNELGDGAYPAKMQAVHSSSALAVNVFDYWRSLDDRSGIAKALCIPSVGIASIAFEKKYPILTSHIAPNIDVVFTYSNGKCCAIECKFTEPFSKRDGDQGLKEKYLAEFDGWSHLPSISQLAESISPVDHGHKYLQPAQLIKHILGLMAAYKNDKSQFRLVYLYYDTFGDEGAIHKKEIEAFGEVLKRDGIVFQARTWQETILALLERSRDQHQDYARYLFSRYV